MSLTPASGVLARTTALHAGAEGHVGKRSAVAPDARRAATGRQRDPPPARAEVALHTERDVDVLLCVTDGGGRLRTGDRWEPWSPAVWPGSRTAPRAVAAGPDGLTYLTVHRRRAGMTIASPASAARTPPSPWMPPPSRSPRSLRRRAASRRARRPRLRGLRQVGHGTGRPLLRPVRRPLPLTA
ncbi:hypothetical protein NKH77_35750 [Streptomyces sp. M19]